LASASGSFFNDLVAVGLTPKSGYRAMVAADYMLAADRSNLEVTVTTQLRNNRSSVA